MVRAAKEEKGVNTRGNNTVVDWEKQMEADAAIATAQESLSGGGQFIGLRSGVLTFNGAAMPNNELRCVVLDNIFENVYYEEEFDQDNPGAPRCFAYGRFDIGTKKINGIDVLEDSTADGGMAPHHSVLNPVHTDCASCPMNQFGTSKTGRGKACSNRRRLALIPVLGTMKKGTFQINVGDIEHYQTAALAYLKTPVTSAKIFGAYVSQVAASLKRPPYGVFTRIFVTPGGDNQFTVNFESIDNIPSSLGKIIMQRHEEAETAIVFPYAQLVDDAPKKGGKAKGGKAAPVKGGKAAPVKGGKAAPVKGGKAAKPAKRY